MPAVNILIKPASSACNMDCTYCFYRDVACNRNAAFEGFLSKERMEQVIISAMDYAQGDCTFTFQGGEPTMAGLAFYQDVLAMERKHARPGVTIHNAIQTNGYCMDEAWASFFAQEQFLVGLSLDGPAELHNLNRKDASGKGTFNRVMRAAALLERYGVPYNILCVVTGKNARSAGRIYDFYKKHKFYWLQFIPCLEPLKQQRGKENYYLSCEDYGAFLIRIFDLWFRDFQKGEYVSIRHIDNWLSILLGNRPEACNMTGCCSVQFVVEGDGGVYPCDFYVLDEWRLGTIGQESLSEMHNSVVARRFIDDSLCVPAACRVCSLYPVCRNGCRRDRLVLPDGVVDRNYYCEAFRSFFDARGDQMRQAAQMILQMRHMI